MKPTRFLIVALVLMGLVATASAITEEGTTISNQAFGNYEDANGNTMPQVESLIVTTTVSQVAGVSLGNNLTSAISAMDSTVYAVTLANTGNGSDTYTIGATGAANDGGTYHFYVYHDANTSGTIDAGDTEVTSSGSVAFTGSFDLLIKVVDRTVGGSNPGEEHVVTLTATSAFDGGVSDVITLTSTIQAAAVTGETVIVGDNTPAPGESITYESCFTNAGTEIAYNPVYVTTMPSNTTLDLTSVSINSGSFVTISTTGVSPYYYDAGTRVLTLELDNLGFETGVDDEVCIQFSAIVDDPLAAGESIDFPAGSPEFTYENGGGDTYPGTTPTEDPATFPPGGVVADQTYSVTLAGTDLNDFTGDPSDTFEFDFTITNTGNGSDSFDLTAPSTYVTWVFYEDLNEDGILNQTDIDNGTVTVAGPLTSNAVGYYIAVGTIPAGTADTEVDNTTITATSQGAAALTPASVVTGTDTNTTTCTAPILTLVKSVTHSGTEYFNGDVNSAAPGDVLTYTIVVANSGTGIATTVVVSDAIPANTTYVAESMTIDGTGDDDDDVVDGAETVDNAFKATSSVLFDFATIPAVTANDDTDMHTLTFQVTID